MTNKEIEIQIALGTLSMWDRLGLTRSKRTSKKILIMLLTDKYWLVREHIAMNFNTPIDMLIKLSTDEDWGVRECVSMNPNTPVDILKKLSKDEDVYVRNNAAKTLLIQASK